MPIGHVFELPSDLILLVHEVGIYPAMTFRIFAQEDILKRIPVSGVN